MFVDYLVVNVEKQRKSTDTLKLSTPKVNQFKKLTTFYIRATNEKILLKMYHSH